MLRGSTNAMGIALMALLLCGTTTRAEDVCFFSTAGFPGEQFRAQVTYARLDDDQLAVTVVMHDVEGDFGADLRLFYGVSPSFTGSVGADHSEASLLSSSMRLDRVEEKQWEADMILAETFPHLAFVLSVSQRLGAQDACPERYMALVLEGSAPPNQRSGELARFRPLDDH